MGAEVIQCNYLSVTQLTTKHLILIPSIKRNLSSNETEFISVRKIKTTIKRLIITKRYPNNHFKNNELAYHVFTLSHNTVL